MIQLSMWLASPMRKALAATSGATKLVCFAEPMCIRSRGLQGDLSYGSLRGPPPDLGSSLAWDPRRCVVGFHGMAQRLRHCAQHARCICRQVFGRVVGRSWQAHASGANRRVAAWSHTLARIHVGRLHCPCPCLLTLFSRRASALVIGGHCRWWQQQGCCITVLQARSEGEGGSRCRLRG